jgi:hypothetical protein
MPKQHLIAMDFKELVEIVIGLAQAAVIVGAVLLICRLLIG